MKNKLLALFSLCIVMIVLAGCGSGTSAQINTPAANTQPGTPIPDGQITVPGVDIQINSPAVSIQVILPGPNPLINNPDAHSRIAGVLMGIWHGVISPVTMLVSFINPNVQMFEVHNDGSPYNLGFLLGVALVFIILGAFAGSRRR